MGKSLTTDDVFYLDLADNLAKDLSGLFSDSVYFPSPADFANFSSYQISNFSHSPVNIYGAQGDVLIEKNGSYVIKRYVIAFYDSQLRDLPVEIFTKLLSTRPSSDPLEHNSLLSEIMQKTLISRMNSDILPSEEYKNFRARRQKFLLIASNFPLRVPITSINCSTFKKSVLETIIN